MVGEHVREVLDALARLPLDPRRGCTVALGAGGARDLGVADVPHEDVPEAVLGLALHRGGAGWADELLARELVQGELDLARVPPAHLGDGAGPEDLAQNGGVLEQALPLRRKRVEAGCDERMHRVRHLLGLAALAAIREQAHELLGIEGVAAGALEQGLLRLGGKECALEERGHQAGRLLVCQRAAG